MNYGIRTAAAVVFVQAVFSSNLFAATTYQFSGTVGSVGDSNFNLDLIGESNVYLSGIAAGTPYSVSMTLDGDLGALSGAIDFDIGGVYQGHMNISGAATVCGANLCTRFGDYNDPIRTRINDVTLANQTAAITTNLPLSSLAYNEVYAWVYLQLAPGTDKPAITTPLTALPIDLIHFDIGSYYIGSQYVFNCPICLEGIEVQVGQGWSMQATSASLAAVPVPAAAYLLGSGIIGLAGLARRR